MLFIILISLSIFLLIISINAKKEVRKETKNTANIEIKDDEKITFSNKDSKQKEKDNNIKVTDVTKNIDNLSEEDNKEIRVVIADFLKSFANYDVEDIKYLMTSELYEYLRYQIETETTLIGEYYVYSKLYGINIYDIKEQEGNILVGVSTVSDFFDRYMKEQDRGIVIDYKFSLSKINGVWTVNDFNENYK